MKKQCYVAIAIAILVGAVGIGTKAQSRNRQLLTVNIPFAFNAGSKTLPAGEYTLMVVNPASDRNVLQIRSSDGHTSVLTQTTDIIGKSSPQAKLVFRRYGDQYFLSQAWVAGERTGVATLKSSAERQLQNELAKTGKKSEMVAVNAK